MPDQSQSFLVTAGSVIGAAVAGPAGSIIGGTVGGLLDQLMPTPVTVAGNVFGNIFAHPVQGALDKAWGRLTAEERRQINYELQIAFREALRQALCDIGGKACFPKSWQGVERSVPEDVVYPLKKLRHRNRELADQVVACLKAIDQAVEKGELPPLKPLPGQDDLSLEHQVQTPASVIREHKFFDELIAPYFMRFGSLAQEAPDFADHLRKHLLSRTQVHLAELLKQRTPAWRAFNQLLLESIRDSLHGLAADQRELVSGQKQIIASLDEFLDPKHPVKLTALSQMLIGLLRDVGEVKKSNQQVENLLLGLGHRVTEEEKKTREHFDQAGDQWVERILAEIRSNTAPAKTVSAQTAADRALRATMPASADPTLQLEPVPSVSHFVGREEELAGYAEMLRQEQLVVIKGIPGVGKTTLGAKLAHQEAEQPEQIFWFTFDKIEKNSADALFWSLAAFLHGHGKPDLWNYFMEGLATQKPLNSATKLNLLLSGLSSGNYILCFDNLHLLKDKKSIFELGSFLQRIQQQELPARLIMVGIGLPAQMEYLAVDSLKGFTLQEAQDFAKARKLELPVSLSQQLLEHTQGNVMLLKLSFASLSAKRRNLAAMEDFIQHMPEQQNISSYLMTHIYETLPPQEKKAIDVLSVFSTPVPRTVVEHVLPATGVADAVGFLDALVRADIVNWDEHSLIHCHSLVRDCRYRALKPKDKKHYHQRVAEYYERQEEDYLAASHHRFQAGDYSQAAHLLTDHVLLLINRYQAAALRQALERFTAQQLKDDKPQWAEINIARGEVYALLGQSQPANDSYQEAHNQLALLPPSDEMRILQARACRGMGALLEYESPSEAMAWIQRGLDELARVSVLEEGILHLRAGSVLIGAGDYPAALGELQESLRLLPPGPSDWRARALTNLGIIHCSQGKLEQGKQDYLQALEIYRQLQNPWGMGGIHQNLGIVLETTGDWQGAVEQYQQALELAERLGSLRRQAALTHNLGILQTKQGQMEAARACLSKSLDIARNYKLKEYQVAGLSSLADLHIRLGEWEQASTSLQEAEQLALTIGAKSQLPEIGRNWAEIRFERRDLLAAQDDAERSVNLAHELGLQAEEGMSLRVLGQALDATGQHEAAMNAFEQSLSLLTDCDTYETARTQAQWGLALLSNSEVDRGANLLQDACVTFQQLGAQRDLEAVDAVLHSNR